MASLVGHSLIFFVLFVPAFLILLVGMDGIVESITFDWQALVSGKMTSSVAVDHGQDGASVAMRARHEA